MGRASNSRGSMRSSVVPSAELYVAQSSDASRTSWKRDSAQKSRASLR